MRVCNLCNLDKPLTDFYTRSKACKECRKVKCDQCGIVFAYKNALTRHIETVHDKIKKYKCEHCDYTCGQKSCLKVHTCYTLRADGLNTRSVRDEERAMQMKLEKQFGGTMKSTPNGVIDILTDTELIEIKHWKYYKTAIGQVYCYGVHYPDHQKHIHFFGVRPTDIDRIITTCTKCGIIVTYE